MSSTKVKDVINFIEKSFPLNLAEDWDNTGLQVGSYDNIVKHALIALDINQAVVDKAIENKAELIITHHPMIFKGIKKINYDTSQGRLIKSLINNDITVYSAHTNLDAGENGLNQLLATRLGLTEIKPLYKGKQDKLVKLVIYVPFTHMEEVRQAINDAGSGNIGSYSDCSFRTPGIGTFKPGEDTNPFIGQPGKLEEVKEYRFETVLYESNLEAVIETMKKVHPYEEVAYDLYELGNDGKNYSMGRLGFLSEQTSLQDFAKSVKTKLELDHLRVVGDLSKPVKKIAVISGAGTSLMNEVINKGVDVLVTGDVKYHEARDAQEMGLAIIDAGHQGTEEIVVSWLKDWLNMESNLGIKFSIALLDQCFQPF